MAMTVDQFVAMQQALLPAGMAWPRNPDAVLTKLLRSWADEFARESGRVDDLLNEFIPVDVQEMLPDWERVLGLPDACCSFDVALTVDQRRTNLNHKLTSAGGQSRQFYIDLAAKLGYTDVSIDEFRLATCTDSCESTVYGREWKFAWQMNVGDYISIHTMSCSDPCDSPLRSWVQTELQCRINQLKAAHTVAIVNWTMTQPQVDVVLSYGREDITAAAAALRVLMKNATF